MDDYRESQKKNQEAFDMGELKTGRGLHKEVGISRACDTRWGSHFKSFNCFILNSCSLLLATLTSSMTFAMSCSFLCKHVLRSLVIPKTSFIKCNIICLSNSDISCCPGSFIH